MTYNPNMFGNQAQDLENMYPELYNIVYPKIINICNMMDGRDNNNMYPIPKRETVEQMVDQVQKQTEEEIEMRQMQEIREMQQMQERQGMQDMRQIERSQDMTGAVPTVTRNHDDYDRYDRYDVRRDERYPRGDRRREHDRYYERYYGRDTRDLIRILLLRELLRRRGRFY